MKELTKAGL